MELKNSHTVAQGPTLISRIQDELDEAYKDHMKFSTTQGRTFHEGLVQGLAISLGILRSSSRPEEVLQANARYIAKQNSKDGVVT